MTRMSNREEGQREELENGLLGLRRALADMELIELRIRQAKRRSGLKDLLDPALGDIVTVRERIVNAQAVLTDIWNKEYRE